MCFVQGRGQKSEQKPTTKSFVGYHNHLPLLTMFIKSGEIECTLITHLDSVRHWA